MEYGIATFLYWIADFGVGLGFPISIAAIGLLKTFFVFVGLGVIYNMFSCIRIGDLWKITGRTGGEV